jgi:endonuclease YncB( thermonuclease family)
MVAVVWLAGRAAVDRAQPDMPALTTETDDDMGALFDEDGNLLQPQEEPEKPAPAAPSETAGVPGPGELERVAPRQPLSKLGQAHAPAPKDWKGTIMYKPLASAAGRFDALGYQVAVSGIDIVPADETCTYAGKSWDCGIRARTAFRSFLRGRSPTCTVPPQPDRNLIVADCRLGMDDIGAWLVENGWARAAAGGRYADAEGRAKDGHRGIFGPAPDTTLPAPPAPLPQLLVPAPAIAEPLDGEEQPEAVTILPGAFPPAPRPPAGLPAPSQ